MSALPFNPHLATELPHAIPAADLSAEMQKAFCTVEELQKKLHCSSTDLADTLASDDLATQFRLRLALATLNLKYLALAQPPAAFSHLTALMDAEKPETARRAATTILAIAGIASATAAEKPATPTLPKPQPLPFKQVPDLAVVQRLHEITPFTPDQLARLDHGYMPWFVAQICDGTQRAALKGLECGTFPIFPQHLTTLNPDLQSAVDNEQARRDDRAAAEARRQRKQKQRAKLKAQLKRASHGTPSDFGEPGRAVSEPASLGTPSVSERANGGTPNVGAAPTPATPEFQNS